MSPANAKALNTMRQRLKKHNLQYADEIQRYKEAPESTEEEASSDSDEASSASESESDDEDAAGGTKHGLMITLSCTTHMATSQTLQFLLCQWSSHTARMGCSAESDLACQGRRWLVTIC